MLTKNKPNWIGINALRHTKRTAEKTQFTLFWVNKFALERNGPPDFPKGRSEKIGIGIFCAAH